MALLRVHLASIHKSTFLVQLSEKHVNGHVHEKKKVLGPYRQLYQEILSGSLYRQCTICGTVADCWP